MAIAINKATFLGNLTDNAKTFTFGDKQKTVFRVAVSRGSGTDFMPCALWNRPAVVPYLVKGVEVYVETSYRTETYQRDGQTVDRSHFVVTFLKLGRSPRSALSSPAGEANHEDGFTVDGGDVDSQPEGFEEGEFPEDAVQG